VLVLIAVVAVAAGFALGFFVARARGDRRAGGVVSAPPVTPAPAPLGAHPATPIDTTAPPVAGPTAADTSDAAVVDSLADERARILRSYEAEAASLRAALLARDAAITHVRAFADDRSRQFAELAQARAETARYRQLVVDLENNAPPILFGPGAPDDLKLIVGVGPVLERMLHQLGVTMYRQIARWTERDIDEFDARLAEFPGRIRRDAWVTQARALHQSKYGERL